MQQVTLISWIVSADWVTMPSFGEMERRSRSVKMPCWFAT